MPILTAELPLSQNHCAIDLTSFANTVLNYYCRSFILDLAAPL